MQRAFGGVGNKKHAPRASRRVEAVQTKLYKKRKEIQIKKKEKINRRHVYFVQRGLLSVGLTDRRLF